MLQDFLDDLMKKSEGNESGEVEEVNTIFAGILKQLQVKDVFLRNHFKFTLDYTNTLSEELLYLVSSSKTLQGEEKTSLLGVAHLLPYLTPLAINTSVRNATDFDFALYMFWQIAFRVTNARTLSEEVGGSYKNPIPYLILSYGEKESYLEYFPAFFESETGRKLESFDEVLANHIKQKSLSILSQTSLPYITLTNLGEGRFYREGLESNVVTGPVLDIDRYPFIGAYRLMRHEKGYLALDTIPVPVK